MPLIIFESYCLRCGYSFVHKEDVGEETEVIQNVCDRCGHLHYIHRCGKDKYSKMSVREKTD